MAFHAQQAAEKALKAVLAFRGIRYGRTHNLATLIDLARQGSIAVPDWADAVTALTPFGAALRYEQLPSDPETVDRRAILSLIERLRAWSEKFVGSP